jgi:hypothetical protein
MNFRMTLMLALLVGCGAKREVVQFNDGKDGKDGKNGHSLVSEFNDASDLECPNGGTRLDIFIDLDDSLTPTEDDKYLGSLVACNGANGKDGVDGEAGLMGPQGEVGPQGPAGEQGVAGPVGPMGPQGPAGAQGAQGLPGATGSSGAIIKSYEDEKCVKIEGTSFFTKPNGKNSGIFKASDCKSSSKEFELGEGDSMWLSADTLAVKLMSTGLRTIKFN